MMCVNMKFLLFHLLFIALSKGEDYTKIDYCADKMKCKEEKNAGCECGKLDEINEIKTDVLRFREEMVVNHNKLRQHIASGEEKNASTGEAANMNALSYDMELEYLAQCWLMGPTGPITTGKNVYHDKCRMTKTFGANAGQNLAFQSKSDFVTDPKEFYYSVRSWYDEVKIIKGDTIENFEPGEYGHFTALVWAKITHLGCARGCRKKMGGSDKLHDCNLVCNYSGKDEKVNVKGKSVYEKGAPCSKCPNEKKCNTQYNALCGDIEPTPTDNLVDLKPKSEVSKSSALQFLPHEFSIFFCTFLIHFY